MVNTSKIESNIQNQQYTGTNDNHKQFHLEREFLQATQPEAEVFMNETLLKIVL